MTISFFDSIWFIGSHSFAFQLIHLVHFAFCLKKKYHKEQNSFFGFEFGSVWTCVGAKKIRFDSDWILGPDETVSYANSIFLYLKANLSSFFQNNPKSLYITSYLSFQLYKMNEVIVSMIENCVAKAFFSSWNSLKMYSLVLNNHGWKVQRIII